MKKVLKLVGKWGLFMGISAIATWLLDMPTPIVPKDKEEQSLEAAIAVYRYINDIKLEKKYISKFQYDENERLITAIQYNAPFV